MARTPDLLWLAAGLLVLMCSGCRPQPAVTLQGYVEGEFVYVSPPQGGRITKLAVERGRQVKAGDLLFEMEAVAETAVRDEATHRLAQAAATLEDAKKGRRPSELDSLQAQLRQARESLALAEAEFIRQDKLAQSGAISAESIDRARSAKVQGQQRVEQLEADLATARLGLREDAIAALEAEIQSRKAALTKAEWDLAQRRQTAPQAGQVTDTLYREGETISPGRPVVVLLPPAQIKIRAFIPEPKLATLHLGDALTVRIDGLETPISARVSYIAAQAEYTPPVIYSQENRSKLVFMVELKVDETTAARLHPGQPVDLLP